MPSEMEAALQRGALNNTERLGVKHEAQKAAPEREMKPGSPIRTSCPDPE